MSIAGRLDKEVAGVTILTQDNRIVQRIISPFGRVVWGKSYMLTASLPFSGREKEIFGSGTLKLKDEVRLCKPADFEIISHEKRTAKYDFLSLSFL